MTLLLLLDEDREALEPVEADIVGKRLEEKLAPWMTPDLALLCQAVGAMAQPVMEVAEDEGFDGEPGYIPGYGRIFDPRLCPAQYLPYLGMFVGVQIPIGASEAEARALVKAESGLERGTEASVKAAIERAISRFWAPNTAFTAGQLVRHESPEGLLCYEATSNFTSGPSFTTAHLTLVNIATQYEPLPREKANGESNPYYFTVLVHPQQLTPEGSIGRLDANVKGVKPAGLVPEYVLTEEPLQTDPYIDEFARLIENIAGEIETLTLAEVT